MAPSWPIPAPASRPEFPREPERRKRTLSVNNRAWKGQSTATWTGRSSAARRALVAGPSSAVWWAASSTSSSCSGTRSLSALPSGLGPWTAPSACWRLGTCRFWIRSRAVPVVWRCMPGGASGLVRASVICDLKVLELKTNFTINIQQKQL